MIELYHAPLSRSVRVRWLLEELELPYEIHPMEVKPESLQTPAYRAIHPAAKVPAIRDGEQVLFESGAILQYLLERYGHGRLEPGPGTPERPLYWQWFHFAEATLMPPLGEIAQHSFMRPKEERISALVPDARRRAERALDAVEPALEGRSFLLGGSEESFSAADVMMGYSVKLAELLRCLDESRPNLRRYLARLETRPAFQKALA